MAKAVRIFGVKRLNRKLTKLPVAAEREIRKAMALGADEIVTLMKSLVPVRPGAGRGALRDSIAWTWGDAPSGAVGLATVNATNGSLKITIYAGNKEAYYAAWVEFGTAPHIAGGKFKGAQHPGTSANPFFFVSFRALRRRTKSRITRSITKSARQVVNGSNA